MSDIALLLGAADQFPKGCVGEIEQRGLADVLLQRLFLLRRNLDLACHEFPPPILSLAESRETNRGCWVRLFQIRNGACEWGRLFQQSLG